MNLSNHRYGKSCVRVARIRRDGPVHSFSEVCVEVALSGDFESSFTAGDNSRVVATDTMKNTVNVLAQTELGAEIERFGLALSQHFLEKYSQVTRCEISLSETVWQRIVLDGAQHPHAFTGNDSSHPWAKMAAQRGAAPIVSAGVRDFVVLKTTESAFAGFPRCEFTTLPETEDRIFCTAFSATWEYDSLPASFTNTRAAAMGAMIQTFANNFSPSVQTTLFEMGRAVLQVVPEVARLHLILPNRHYLPVNLAPFGRVNANEIFTPASEPHGLIEATVIRNP